MNLTIEEIKEHLNKRKKATKLLVLFYHEDINNGVPYDIIIGRIKSTFGVDITYNSFAVAVHTHLKKIKPKSPVLRHEKVSNTLEKVIESTTPKYQLEILPDAEDVKRNILIQNKERIKDLKNPFDI